MIVVRPLTISLNKYLTLNGKGKPNGENYFIHNHLIDSPLDVDEISLETSEEAGRKISDSYQQLNLRLEKYLDNFQEKPSLTSAPVHTITLSTTSNSSLSRRRGFALTCPINRIL